MRRAKRHRSKPAPTDPARLHARILALHARGHSREAMDLYRMAQLYSDPRILTHFGNTALRFRRFDAAERLFERAIESGALDADAHNRLGVARMNRGALELACASFECAVRLSPLDYQPLLNLGCALSERGDLDAAFASLTRALELAPHHPGARCSLAEVHLKSGRPGDALTVLAGLPTGTPPAWPSALSAVAHEECDDRESAARHQNLLLARSFRNAAHADFGDSEAFRRRLRQHIAAHPSLDRDPDGLSTRNGANTQGNLLLDDGALVAGLRGLVEDCIGRYLADLSAAGMGVRAPQQRHLEGWGVVLSRGGFHESHIHRDGWLSGVYYVDLGGVVRSDDPEHAGWIEIGRGPTDLYALGSQPETLLVQPEEGSALLFPSSFWHRTLPFARDAERVAFAFDVVPKG